MKLSFSRIKSFFLENQTIRQTVAKNVFWMSLSNIVGRIIRAALIIAVARVLGTEGYGVFSYALSLAAFFTIFSDIGVTQVLTREAAKNPESKKEYLSTSFFVKIALIGVTILVTTFVAPHFTNIEAAKPLMPIMAFLLTFDGLQNFAFGITRAENRMEIEAWFYILTNLFIVGLSTLTLFIAPTSRNLALAYTAGSGLGFISVYWALRDEFSSLLDHFNKSLVKKILVAGWPFALMGLLGSIMINTDTLMLGWFRSASELGLYSAAQRPIQLIYLLPGILATGLFPVMARLVEVGGRDRLKEILEKAIGVVLLAAFPIFAGGLLLGAPIMGLLFGRDYIPASTTFIILLGTVFSAFPSLIMSNLIFAYDRQKVFIVSMGFGAVGNFIFDLLLIPPFGIAGSSVATLIAQVLTFGYVWYEARKLLEFSVSSQVKKIAPATLLMALATLAMEVVGVHLISNILISALLYFLFLRLLGEPLLRELKLILRSAA